MIIAILVHFRFNFSSLEHNVLFVMNGDCNFCSKE